MDRSRLDSVGSGGRFGNGRANIYMIRKYSHMDGEGGRVGNGRAKI